MKRQLVMCLVTVGMLAFVSACERADDGSQNLVGAIKTCMGYMGAQTIREFQETEVVIAPAIKTEGKIFQKAQNIGMAKN